MTRRFKISQDSLPYRGCDDLLSSLVVPDLESDQPSVEDGGTITYGLPDLRRVRPLLQWSFKLQSAINKLDLRAEDLEWAITLRDPHLRRCIVVSRGDMQSDQQPNGTLLLDPMENLGLTGNKGIRLDVLVALRRNLKPIDGRPFHTGAVIARHTVEMRTGMSEPLFPMRYAEESWFLAKGLPSSTLWWIEVVQGASVSMEPAAVIRVAISESLRSFLGLSERPNNATRFIASYVSADILMEITCCMVKLQGEATFDEEPTGLAERIANAFFVAGVDESHQACLERLRYLVMIDPSRLRVESQRVANSSPVGTGDRNYVHTT